ncbi:DMT family transporter [Nocardia stercoris]|uniref:DMT family transporter n=1 Tax=Nocardia stercoris TaxID=2483361 RepID=UPI001F397028|nr:DMT family transporter [Nocardia stercoris]
MTGPIASLGLGPMSTGEVLSILLALVSAMLFAVCAALQQSSTRKAALAREGDSRFLAVAGLARTLLTNRAWLLGQGATVIGFACHAAALRFGPIALVQSLLVVQLLFALPMSAQRHHSRVLRRDWIGTALVCVGLAFMVAQGVPHGVVRSERLPYAAVVIVCAVVVLMVASRLVPSTQLRSALTAMASGCCISGTAVQTAVATTALPHFSWALLGIPITTTVGAILTQEAYAHGSLPTVLTTMTITDPVLSYAAGLTLFTVSAAPNPLSLGLTAALVFTGVTILANSPTLYDDRKPGAGASDRASDADPAAEPPAAINDSADPTAA